MTDHLHAEFAKLWTSAQTPPDVVKFLGSLANPSPKQIGSIVKLDQQCRWKTAAPMIVEDYLNAVGEWRNDQDVILEFTAGEFLARLDVQHLPHVGEYAARFPHLESQIRQKLSGLSTNGAGNTPMVASIRESLDRVFEIDDICDAFGRLWRESPTAPFIEAWVLHGRREERTGLLKELLRVELCVRVERKEAPTLQEYRQRFADESPFRDILNDWEQHPQQYMLTGVPSTKQVSPQEAGATLIGQFPVHSSQSGTLELDGSQRIGHFRLLKQLGRGTFGRVYRAHDEQLERAVAIKVPRRSRFRRPEDAEAYLAEARTVARLDHPGIVPVYQAGRSDDGAVYVVSRLIEGRSLEEVIKNQRPDHPTTAQLVAKVARALHFAHQHRVIHRDIKPANILIDDATGTPFVADFGLAMKEEDYLKQAGTLAGTPAYMSPEQARAEGHRLDGRSDLFALGVVLYELLTGKRPFRGSTANETLYQVISVDPHPPRSIDETIPAELERICLKAISKRTSDRYASGELMAGDLEAWLKPVSSPLPGRKTDVQVVPKGLRSFDANDADFFLDLLPGQRTRDGLPESVAFWKERIEQTDPEQTFTVGLIYGPSGCGKSSLVKAGLLPHLSKDVIAVYLEATPEDTELRILRGLRKRVESLDSSAELQGGNVGWTFLSDSISTGKNAHPTPNRSLPTSAPGLTETILHLRRGQHQKIVIIIDQFEQWLHAHRAEPDAELVRALRQCDGVHVQAIVMIRDDFAMAAARFMQALDVSIVQGQNFATVDLFEIDHAKNVLLKFGQAFGKLPANRENLSADENQFVSDIAHGLSQDSKVVSVRLSLFAEMIKTKRWMPETLQAVGGTEGIGVNFLEETFSSPQANPRHRLHATAARAVLRSLLPDLGSDIKGHMRSQQEVLEASGYQDRPPDFTDLLRILDGELRLITPTDPEGDSLSGDSSRNSSLATRYYQLTHDYLVPSLREWLTRKQRETRKGRAELKLEERAAIWNAKRENKQLPTVSEWFSIRILTDSKRWTDSQRVMLRKAARVHGTLWGGLLLTVLLIGAGIQQWVAAERETNLREQTQTAVEAMQNNLGPSVPFNLEKLRTLPEQFVLPELQTRFASATNASHKLSLAFALARYGELDTEYLVSQIDDITDADKGNYFTALLANPANALSALKNVWNNSVAPGVGRLEWNVKYFSWPSAGPQQPPADWQGVIASSPLLERLQPNVAFNRRNGAAAPGVPLEYFALQATAAANFSAGTYRAKTTYDDGVRIYIDDKLIVDHWSFNHPTTNEVQFKVTDGQHTLRVEYFQINGGFTLSVEAEPVEAEPLWRRKVRLSIAALGLGDTELARDVCTFENRPNPEQRTLFIDEFPRWEVDLTPVLAAVKNIDSAGLRSGICLAVGQLPVEKMNERDKESWKSLASQWFVEHGDTSTHSAAGWLLRQWKLPFPEIPNPHEITPQRDWFVVKTNGATMLRIRAEPPAPADVIPDPVVLTEMDGAEKQVKVDGEFWVADREVTRGQFEEFMNDTNYAATEKPVGWNGVDIVISPTADHPAQQVSWYDAVLYCNWLSQREGLQPCYERTGTKEKGGSDETLYDAWRVIPGATGYRLLHEAEWEYACRAGTSTEYSSGDDETLLVDYCQMAAKLTSVCGEKLPNAWGLHDAHGNVWEWCAGLFGESRGSYRVARGGSWFNGAAGCRSAFRSRYDPSYRGYNYGLRVALSSPSGVSSAAEQFQAK